MVYSPPQRQLLVDALISMLPYEPFYKHLGAGHKQNAIESINYYCKGADFKALNESECAESLAKKQELGDVDNYLYNFEFVWYIPGTNQKITMKKSIGSEMFEARR